VSKQAKTLSAQEIRRVLDYVATRKHSLRNRAMLLTMYYAGLRVKECAALRYEDVFDGEGKVRAEIRLTPEQTKGSKAGTVLCQRQTTQRASRLCQIQCHPSHSNTSCFIHRSVRKRAGTAILFANSFITCLRAWALRVHPVTAQDVR